MLAFSRDRKTVLKSVTLTRLEVLEADCIYQDDILILLGAKISRRGEVLQLKRNRTY